MQTHDDQALAASLSRFRHGELDAATLVAIWRGAATVWPGLPARYATVLERLLAPLEASALFTDESCSFSHSDLADALGQWLDHARALRPSGPG